MDELKPCPFCGNSAWERIAYDTWKKKIRFTVQCKKCNAVLKYASRKAAVKAWNRRVEDGK